MGMSHTTIRQSPRHHIVVATLPHYGNVLTNLITYALNSYFRAPKIISGSIKAIHG